MKEFLAQFQEYIQLQNLKMTPQRTCIAEVFLQSKGHLSVEELHDRVKAVDTSIGQATIYRTLKLLCGAEIAKEVHFGDTFARYELFDNTKHHDHLICDKCGDNVEVLDEQIELLQEELARQHGYTLTSHRMYLHGICPKCREK
ncbi:MAG: Fur family transcriptional regulator [Pseudomonadota bacterium]